MKPASLGVPRDNYMALWEATTGQAVSSFYIFEPVVALTSSSSSPSQILLHGWMVAGWRGLRACRFVKTESSS